MYRIVKCGVYGYISSRGLYCKNEPVVIVISGNWEQETGLSMAKNWVDTSQRKIAWKCLGRKQLFISVFNTVFQNLSLKYCNFSLDDGDDDDDDDDDDDYG